MSVSSLTSVRDPFTKAMKNRKFRIISNFLGVCACTLTISVHVYWGNLSAYVLSYARDRVASDAAVPTPWVISLIFIGWSVTMALAGYIADFLGHKWTIVLGSCFIQAGMLSGYFLIQSSLDAFNFTFGILIGCGSGFVNCIGLQSVLSYKPKYPGILTALVSSCISGGAVMLNQIITLFINPNNLTPDLHIGRQNYFAQPEILKKLPTVFFVIGGFNLCCLIIGIFLLKPKDEKDLVTSIEEETKRISDGVAAPQTAGNLEDVMNLLKPRDVLKTKAFYALWFTMGVTDFTALVHLNYYKTYGQIWIHDDHFMAALASSVSLVMAIARIVWGLLTENFGVKYSIILLSCALSVIPSFWYFAPMAGRWFYLVWTILYGFFAAGVYIVFAVGALRLFGSEHFSHNYGMVMTSRILTNLAAPFLIEFIVTEYGYFYLFFGVGCCNVVGMALIIDFLPRI